MFKLIILSFTIAVALSIDSFLACFAFATDKQKSKRTIIYTPIFIGVLHFIFPVISFSFCNIFLEDLKNIGKIISGTIFIALGIISFVKKDETNDNLVNFISVLLLAVGVSIDSLLVGIPLSFEFDSIYLPATIFGITVCVITYLSILIGKYVTKKMKFDYDYIAGVFFIILGGLAFMEII